MSALDYKNNRENFPNLLCGRFAAERNFIMNYNRINISDGWQLGWCEETKLNKWVQLFGEWEVKNGSLRGWRPGARMYANKPLPENYIFDVDFSLSSELSCVEFSVGFSLIRLAQYSVYFRGNGPANGAYFFSGMWEENQLENLGSALEAGKTHHVRVEVIDGYAEYFINEQSMGKFAMDRPHGDRVMLTIADGEAFFNNFKVTTPEGDILFFDDFSEDSLVRRVPVELSELDVKEWIPAKIPGSVHGALLDAGKIEDPYVGYNGPKQLWIDDQRWVYKKTFTVPAEWKGKIVRLDFKGVDYHGYFWVNGIQLCYHEGMLGGPDLDITPYIDFDGENEVVVCILPCPNPPSHNVRPYIFGRWHFNMDILPCGIWRNVELVAQELLILSEPHVMTKSISEDGTAHLSLSATVASMAAWPFECKVKFAVSSPDENEQPYTAEVITGFSQGAIRATAEIDIPNAKLWWPNGMGEQTMYKVDITGDLKDFTRNNRITGHDELHFNVGIRTLKMKPSPNKNGMYNWVFCINGRDFFGKGSNWMPTDQMLDFTTEKYERLLGLAKEANINILRPWGAGLIETDEFYDTCDKLGICVWQETLMANNNYDKVDRNVWRDTLKENVIRVRNHPSLVMWCGGNEFDPDSVYNKDVVDDIEHICRDLDPEREFHRASPYGGDNHSYQVNWMEGMYYPRYTTDMSVAVTEFSMASPPVMDTLKKLIPEDEMQIFPPNLPDEISGWNIGTWNDRVPERCESGFSMHDAHLTSITRIMFNPMSDVGIPKNWEEYVRYTQTAHGMLTQFGQDFWRARWPYCTCSMSWVFNVVFPSSMSWAYVDGYGIPKRSYYYKKRSFEPLHICACYDDLFTRPGETFTAKISVINEHLCEYSDSKIVVRLYDSKFNLLKTDEKSRTVYADMVTTGGFFDYEVPNDAKEECMFLVCDLLDRDGALLSRSQYSWRVGQPSRRAPYIANGPWISDVSANTTTLDVKIGEVTVDEKGTTIVDVSITNSGSLPAFQVGIEAPDNEYYMNYSDNFFWLEAGETQTVTVKISNDNKEFTVNAWNTEKTTVKI